MADEKKYLDYDGLSHTITKIDNTYLKKVDAYVHPTYTTKDSGLYKIAVDSKGHVSSATAVVKADITALGIPSTNTTYNDATTSASGLMSASDKTKLDGISTGAEKNVVTNVANNGDSASTTGVNITMSSGTVYEVAKIVKSGKIHANVLPLVTTTVDGAMSSTDKAKLDNVEVNANNYVHPTYTTKDSGLYKVTIDATGHVSGTSTVTKADITALGIPSQDTVYTLPTATSSVLGGVKTGSNITNTSGTISLTKTNVTNALGYTPPTTNTTYNDATTSASGLMSASDKTKLDGIEENANKYTHPSYTAITGKPTGNQTPAFGGTATVSQITSDASGHVTGATDRTITIPSTLSNGTGTAGLIKTTSTVTSNSGYTACPVISGVPYYKNTTYTLSSFGITATASELNALDGITATVTELNYCDGVTSNIQTQLNGKASSSHNHSEYALKSDITGLYKYKGSVNTESNLPTSPSTGDVYNIVNASSYGDKGTNVAWTGSAWDSLGTTFVITSITSAEIDALF